jgi:hypothetical protein
VERKARFIGQVMRGRLDVREIEDVGETALSYSVIWTTSVLPRAESIGGLAPQHTWSFAPAARCRDDIGARKRSASGTGCHCPMTG